MKKSLPFYLSAVLPGFIFIFSGCTAAYYDPYFVDLSRQKENSYTATSKPNTPLLSEKYDLNFGTNYLTADKHKGAQFDFSFAPSNHFGLITSVAIMNNTNSNISHYEFGAGYFKEISSILHFEAFAGLGGGKVKNDHHTGRSLLNTGNYFFQPTIAVTSTNKAVKFAFTSKFNSTHFNLKDTSFSNDREAFSAGEIKNIVANPSHIYWEPAILFRAGQKRLAFEAGYTFSKDLSGNEIYGSKGTFSIGMILHVNASSR